MRFDVSLIGEARVTCSVRIEADSEDEAMRLAVDNARSKSLDWSVEDAYAISAIDADNLDEE